MKKTTNKAVELSRLEQFAIQLNREGDDVTHGIEPFSLDQVKSWLAINLIKYNEIIAAAVMELANDRRYIKLTAACGKMDKLRAIQIDLKFGKRSLAAENYAPTHVHESGSTFRFQRERGGCFFAICITSENPAHIVGDIFASTNEEWAQLNEIDAQTPVQSVQNGDMESMFSTDPAQYATVLLEQNEIDADLLLKALLAQASVHAVQQALEIISAQPEWCDCGIRLDLGSEDGDRCPACWVIEDLDPLHFDVEAIRQDFENGNVDQNCDDWSDYSYLKIIERQVENGNHKDAKQMLRDYEQRMTQE